MPVVKRLPKKPIHILQMEEELSKYPHKHPKRVKLQKQLNLLRSGWIGEKNVAYHLEFWFGDIQNYYVINDLRLEINEHIYAQIDHLILTPKCIIIIESKSVNGIIKINSRGEWQRVHQDTGEINGIYNPFDQNRRHVSVLKKFLAVNQDKLGDMGDMPIYSLIVMSNEKTVVKDETPEQVIGKSVVRVENLDIKINDLISQTHNKCYSNLQLLVDLLLSMHKEPKSVSSRSKTVAIMLAVLFGPWTWLYTYKLDKKKFWAGILLWLYAPVVKVVSNISIISLVTIGFWFFAIVQAIIRPKCFYDQYPFYFSGSDSGTKTTVRASNN